MSKQVLIETECNVNETEKTPLIRIVLVLIETECNVNLFGAFVVNVGFIVLIETECNVNISDKEIAKTDAESFNRNRV